MTLAGRRRALAILGPAALLILGLFLLGGRERSQATTFPRAAGEPSPLPEGLSLPAPLRARDPSLSRAPASGLARRTMRITDEEDRPISARVRIAFSNDRFQKFEMMEIETDPDGRVSLDLDPAAWVVVSVQSPGRSPAWQPPVTWGDLQNSDLDFQLPAGTRADGVARWIDGRPMAGVRLAFRPQFPPGEFAGQIASRLKIVDEEVTTDASGKFRCSSLRPGPYRVSFPDHPRWPALVLAAEELRAGALGLQAHWAAPAPR